MRVEGMVYGSLPLEWNSLDGEMVCCPVCQMTFTFVANDHMALEDGQYDDKAGWSGRGNLRTIWMSCESSHSWQLCIGSNEGSTYLFYRYHPDWINQGEMISETCPALSWPHALTGSRSERIKTLVNRRARG